MKWKVLNVEGGSVKLVSRDWFCAVQKGPSAADIEDLKRTLTYMKSRLWGFLINFAKKSAQKLIKIKASEKRWYFFVPSGLGRFLSPLRHLVYVVITTTGNCFLGEIISDVHNAHLLLNSSSMFLDQIHEGQDHHGISFKAL